MFNFWWLAEWSEQITLTKTEKNEKGPLSHRKIKCLFLDYIQLLMIGRAIWAEKNVDQNTKKWKRPPRSLKNKMFVFWIMFNFWWSAEWSEQMIWANNIDRNTKRWKKPPKSLKNKMFVFGLHSTSDDRPSDLSKKCWLKCKKMKKAP